MIFLFIIILITNLKCESHSCGRLSRLFIETISLPLHSPKIQIFKSVLESQVCCLCVDWGSLNTCCIVNTPNFNTSVSCLNGHIRDGAYRESWLFWFDDITDIGGRTRSSAIKIVQIVSQSGKRTIKHIVPNSLLLLRSMKQRI